MEEGINRPIRIATRSSKLALWQAEWVRDQILRAAPGHEVTLVKLTTRGDKFLDQPLAAIGGKGLFVKEIEEALLRGEADVAVHSLKDLPAEVPEGLHLAAFPEREDPRDAVVSPRFGGLASLPRGARVGTSSLRRKSQLLAAYPHLSVEVLRGNVDTRLRRVHDGDFDAIILAGAGLRRLGLAGEIHEYLDTGTMIPAVGQGVLAIECRLEDEEILGILTNFDHQPTRWSVSAERAFLARVEGGCQVPMGAHATTHDDKVVLEAFIGRVDGTKTIRDVMAAPAGKAAELGVALAEDLLARGGDAILRDLRSGV